MVSYFIIPINQTSKFYFEFENIVKKVFYDLPNCQSGT